MVIKLYSVDSSRTFIQMQIHDINKKIESENEDYILNVGEEQYVEHLISEFEVDFPEIHFDKAVVDTYETEIQGSHFPNEFHISNPYEKFKRDVIVYEIPYTGDINILKLRPNSYTINYSASVEVDIKNRIIKCEIINYYNDSARIKKSYEDYQRAIMSDYGSLKSDIDKFNNELGATVGSLFKKRKDKFLNQKSFLSDLGVPIKKKSNTSETYSVPSPKLKQKIKVTKPEVAVKGYSPEPTLDNANYTTILKIINDVGKNFERLPSVYSEKGEEDLRDHLLMILDPNFENGSASGETFNFSGKTDIQLRHDSSVVFVAECKFWTGIKGFMATIDQLLGYLTWRDSKTSIIIFVRNKEFSTVLSKVKEQISTHSSFVSEQTQTDESWFNYIFKLPQDSNKEIKMAVQVYHIP